MSDEIHLVFMGVSGTGKTTIAQLLTQRLNWPVADGDDFHARANIAKMTAGQSLTDNDRLLWLLAIRDWMSEHARIGQSTGVSCSALRRAYRDLLRQATGTVLFADLAGDLDLVRMRMAERQGHFMPMTLLQSQYDTLEPLEKDEVGITISIDAPPARIVDEVLRWMHPFGHDQ